jgi:hypothetical protein
MARRAAEAAWPGAGGSELERARFRCERKCLTPLRHGELETLLQTHPAVFREIYRERRVNSLYLDTAGDRDYLDNVDGFSRRCKTRVRWYGDTFRHVEAPVLELKVKRGYLGTKLTYPLAPLRIGRGFSASDLEAAFAASALDPGLRLELRALEPRLLNSYRRRYFVSASGTFRATVDWDLVYYAVRRWRNTFLHHVRDDEHSVLELKYDVGADEAADAVTTLFPFRVTRSSKYVMGRDLLFPV